MIKTPYILTTAILLGSVAMGILVYSKTSNYLYTELTTTILYIAPLFVMIQWGRLYGIAEDLEKRLKIMEDATVCAAIAGIFAYNAVILGYNNNRANETEMFIMAAGIVSFIMTIGYIAQIYKQKEINKQEEKAMGSEKPYQKKDKKTTNTETKEPEQRRRKSDERTPTAESFRNQPSRSRIEPQPF